MATTALEGPIEEALLVKNAADAYAASCKAVGDERRIGVLRSEGLARICGDYLRGFSATGLPPRSRGLPIEIGIVVGVDTALGRSELPAEVPFFSSRRRHMILVSDWSSDVCSSD